MRIYLATPGNRYGRGGIVKQMVYLKDYIDRYVKEVTCTQLQTRGNGGKMQATLVFCLACLRIFAACLLRRVDILHLNLASKGSFTRKYILFRIASLFRVKTVIHLHGGGFQAFYQTSPASRQRRIRALFHGTDHTVVLGEHWKRFLNEELDVAPDRISIIYNAVPEPKTVERTVSDTPHLIFVGHVLPRKGLEELIEALAAPDVQRLKWKLTIAGSGDIAHYSQLAKEAGIEERVTFPGWLEQAELDALFHSADILVLPSHVENQPLSVIEAMAHGLAIVATEVGTLPDMITSGKNGLLVPAKDVAALQQALEQLVSSKDRRNRLGRTARQAYQQHFSLPRYAEQITTLYNQLVQ